MLVPLLTSSPNDALAAWVPSEVLVLVLALALGALYKLILDRAKKTESELAAIKAALVELDKKLIDTATRSMLGSMGDRLDGRITNIAQQVAVLEALRKQGGKE